jgi:hypothetical protein
MSVMVEYGEVACVALVPSTKSKDAAHALQQIATNSWFGLMHTFRLKWNFSKKLEHVA